MVRETPGASGAPGCRTAATRWTAPSPVPSARTEERTSSAPAHNATDKAVLDPNKAEAPLGVGRSTEPTTRQRYCNDAAERPGAPSVHRGGGTLAASIDGGFPVRAPPGAGA